MDDESKRIKEERRTDLKDEAHNPTEEAQQTGAKASADTKGGTGKSDAKNAVRNPSSYENEFGSKKAGPGGYGDREKKPLSDRKKDQDAKKRKKDPQCASESNDTKRHGDKSN